MPCEYRHGTKLNNKTSVSDRINTHFKNNTPVYRAFSFVLTTLIIPFIGNVRENNTNIEYLHAAQRALQRFRNLLLYPIDEAGHARINAGHFRTSASDTVRHDADLVVVELGTEPLRQHQRPTTVTLARILATLDHTGTHDRVVELLLRKHLPDLVVQRAALVVRDDGNLQLLQHVGRLATLLGASPARHERGVADEVLAADRLAQGQTDGLDRICGAMDRRVKEKGFPSTQKATSMVNMQTLPLNCTSNSMYSTAKSVCPSFLSYDG